MNTKEQILNWDRQDITVLRDLIAEQNRTMEKSECPEFEEIDLSDLPSAIEVPNVISAYPVWAIDVKGRALVGAGVDEVEDLDEILEWYATSRSDMQQEYIIRGYESVEKIIGAGNLTSSRVNLPAGWRGKRVKIILLDP